MSPPKALGSGGHRARRWPSDRAPPGKGAETPALTPARPWGLWSSASCCTEGGGLGVRFPEATLGEGTVCLPPQRETKH